MVGAWALMRSQRQSLMPILHEEEKNLSSSLHLRCQLFVATINNSVLHCLDDVPLWSPLSVSQLLSFFLPTASQAPSLTLLPRPPPEASAPSAVVGR